MLAWLRAAGSGPVDAGRRRAERPAVLLPPGHPGARSSCSCTTCTASSGRWSTPALVARVGWWIERRLAPWLYRHCQYVAVSRATRGELRRPRRHAGRGSRSCTTGPTRSCPSTRARRRTRPSRWSAGSCRTSRWSTRSTPCSRCGRSCPGCGCTSWAAAGGRASCTRTPRRASAGDAVVFEGQVDEERKHEVYERAWLLRCPRSRRAGGWSSARPACTRTPTVAYRVAGGTRESIADGRSGVLVDDPRRFTGRTRELLRRPRDGAPSSARGRCG